MANGVDTPEHGMEASGGDCTINRVVTEAQMAQLPPRHDAVLSLGELSQAVPRSVVTLPRYPRLSHNGSEFAPGSGKMAG